MKGKLFMSHDAILNPFIPIETNISTASLSKGVDKNSISYLSHSSINFHIDYVQKNPISNMNQTDYRLFFLHHPSSKI